MMAAALTVGRSVKVEQVTDEALMEEFRQGSVRAFERLLKRHKRPVFNFFARQVRNDAVAEDLFQELFLRVIKAQTTYTPSAKFTTWMYTIARNLLIDNARKNRARDLSSPDNRDTRLDLDMGGVTVTDLEVLDRELQSELVDAVDSLLPEQREVFLMREFLSLRFREIADIIGVSENTVKSRMRYALEHLRERLADVAGAGT